MNGHLSPAILNCLVDDELSAEQLAAAQQHLEICPACTSKALTQTLLKRAVARSGYRYATPAGLAERVKRRQPPARNLAAAGWAAAAIVLVAFFVQSGLRPSRAHEAGLITEVCDVHVATLAAGSAPQVVSSDRHTVKPWFQGKLPFSFNLPQDLPADVTLEGADLSYLQGQPVAQLLYNVGRHRVSVFVRQRIGAAVAIGAAVDHQGFHVTGFATNDLWVVAVSDVDPARLSELTKIFAAAQTVER